MGMPRRPAVERRERREPRLHRLESAQPDETVRVVEVAELADDVGADVVLRPDEPRVEQRDQLVAPARPKGVLTKLEDVQAAHAVRSSRIVQFVSQVAPPSVENACAHCAETGVMSVHRKRTRIGMPSCTSSP